MGLYVGHFFVTDSFFDRLHLSSTVVLALNFSFFVFFYLRRFGVRDEAPGLRDRLTLCPSIKTHGLCWFLFDFVVFCCFLGRRSRRRKQQKLAETIEHNGEQQNIVE